MLTYNKEANDSIMQARKIDQMINNRRAQSRSLKQRTLAKNKSHFQNIMDKLKSSHFNDDLNLTQDQIHSKIKYNNKLKKLNKEKLEKQRLRIRKNEQKNNMLKFSKERNLKEVEDMMNSIEKRIQKKDQHYNEAVELKNNYLTLKIQRNKELQNHVQQNITNIK